LTQSLSAQLAPTPTIESEHPAIVAFVEQHAGKAATPLDAAVRLYYAVRDGIRYDPYTAGNDVESLKASTVLDSGRSWCVGKAILLAAACRARDIPARLGFADVRNHLSTARMRAYMSTDVFYWHGYTSIELEGRWVKATPAFNVELCEKFGLLPLEFDGREDSIYHPFDVSGDRHMEYLNERGEYDDLPLEAMLATWDEHYPNLGTAEDESDRAGWEGGDFDQEVEEESSAARDDAA
jgi:transglutaminase-like putative cysteine protease